MTDLNDDYSANPGTSGKLVVGTPSTGHIEKAGDSDWFAVSLTAGTTYMFTLKQVNGFMWYNSIALSMYDASGTLVVPAITGNASLRPGFEFTPTASGTFFLGASSLYAVPNYAVSADVRTEPDDFSATIHSIGTLLPGLTVEGMTEVLGDHDWFRFHTDANGHYSFGASAVSEGLKLDIPAYFLLRDASGTLLPIQTMPFEPGVEADFFVDVTMAEQGWYKLWTNVLTDDYFGNNLTKGSIAPGGQASGNIDYRGDVDRFKISLAANSFYTFDVNAPAAAGLASFALALRDANGVALSFANASSSSSGAAIGVHVTSAGDYYLDATTYPNYQGNIYPLPYTLSASAPRADDFGDTPATANPMAIGSSVDGRLQSPDDKDTVRLQLDAGTTYLFNLTRNGAASSELNLKLSIADGMGNSVGEADSYRGTPGYYTFTPANSGTYYAWASGGMTDFSLAVGTAPDDFSASVATSGKLAVGASVDGALENGGGDRDWFSLNLSAGTTYFISIDGAKWSHSIGGDLLRLLDASGREVTRAATNSDGRSTAEALSYSVTHSGIYFVEVSSPARSTGGYTLSAAIGEADDYGNTPATAGHLDATGPTHGRLEFSQDKDMFKLSVIAGVSYGIGIRGPNNDDPRVDLVDSAGQPIRVDFAMSSPNYERYLIQPLTSGDLYLTVSNSYNNGVNYTLSLFDYGFDDYSFDTATLANLTPGSSLSATLSYPGDADAVRVKLEAGKSYVFELLGALSGNGTLVAGRTIFEIANSAMYSYSIRPFESGVEPRMAFTPATSGDYFIKVSGGMGSYVLKAITLSGDSTGPTVLAQSHPSDATGVSLGDTTMTFKFSEPITVDAAAFVLTDPDGNVVPFDHLGYGIAPRVNDDTMLIMAHGYFKPGTYTLSMPHAAVHDLAGNQYSGPASYRFTTILPVSAATGGDDLMVGGSGAAIDGGAGVDTVIYPGQSYRFQITHTDTSVSVNAYFSDKKDTLTHVERLLFDDHAVAFDIDGNAGQAYRLYRAAFARAPDQSGLGFWIKQVDHGVTLHDVANGFVESAEFKALYSGAQSNVDFLTHLYTNVFERAPDTGGEAFWLDAMSRGVSRADVLVAFSESPENHAALVGVVSNGIVYVMH
ncbi:MAG: DUF4214 domain-containing protein [Pseudomonadota bacterium]